jgi:hypothetical protein
MGHKNVSYEAPIVKVREMCGAYGQSELTPILRTTRQTGQ